MRAWKAASLLLLLLLLLLDVRALATTWPALAECAELAGRPLRVGVEFEESPTDTLVAWNVTFASYLSSFLHTYGCTGGVQCVALSQHQAQAVISATASSSGLSVPDGSSSQHVALDFLLADPLLLGQVEEAANTALSTLATLRALYPSADTVSSQVAGAVVRRSDRHTELATWEDLTRTNRTERLVLCAVGEGSFAGYQVQQLEFLTRSGQRAEFFFSVTLVGDMQTVLQRVLDDTCALGMAHAAALESLLPNPNADLSVLGRQELSAFPVPHSTRLYPQWGVVSLPHVSPRLADLARIALIAADRATASLPQPYVGFSLASDYSELSLLSYQLDLKRDGSCPAGYQRQAGLCTPCAPGSFSHDASDSCRPCSPGAFSNSAGASQCQRCPDGKSAQEHGADHCEPDSAAFPYPPINACEQFPNRTLAVAVLWEINHDLTMQQWRATLETALNTHFNRYQCYFTLRAISRQQIQQTVHTGAVDLLFADPGVFVRLQHSEGVVALSSLLRSVDGQLSAYCGGLFVRRADRHTDLVTVLDIINASGRALIACPPHPDSFAGWHVLWFEFFKLGVDVRDVFADIRFSGSDASSVSMLLRGECDVAMVQSDTNLQVQEGLPLALIHTVHHPGSVLPVSTPLYPEWPLMALRHVPSELALVVSLPLLAMHEHNPAAVVGSHGGFMPVLDYSAVRELYYELQLIGNQTSVCYPGAFRDHSRPLRPCVKCEPGRYNADGDFACSTCQPGLFAGEAGLATCTRCPPLMTTTDFGMAQCISETEGIAWELSRACEAFPDRTLTVAVVSEDGNLAEAVRTWQPTFQGVLNDFFNPYLCYFRMLAVRSGQDADDALSSGKVDFIFAGPAYATLAHLQRNVQLLATVQGAVNGQVVTKYAGLAVVKAGGPLDVSTLLELASAGRTEQLTACAVSPDSFFGWQVQLLECLEAGVDVHTIFHEIVYIHNEETVVEWVKGSRCDVGMVRMDVIAHLLDQGKLRNDDLAILDAHKPARYPFWVSTRLYSGDVFGALSHVPVALVEAVTLPLQLLAGTQMCLDLDDHSDHLQPLLAKWDRNASEQTWQRAKAAGSHEGFTGNTELPSADAIYLVYQLDLVDTANHTCFPGSVRDQSAPPFPCRMCPPGSVSKDGLTACTPCAESFVSTSFGATECSPCPVGQVTLGPGSSECYGAAEAAVYTLYSPCSAGSRNITSYRLNGLTAFLPPVDSASCVLSPSRLVLLALTVGAILLWVFFFFLAHAHRSYKLFKDVTMVFYYLLCVSMVGVSSSALCWIFPLTDLSCVIRLRLLAVSSSLGLASVLAQSRLWLRPSRVEGKEGKSALVRAAVVVFLLQTIWAIGSLFVGGYFSSPLRVPYELVKGNTVYRDLACAPQTIYSWSALGFSYVECVLVTFYLTRLKLRTAARSGRGGARRGTQTFSSRTQSLHQLSNMQQEERAMLAPSFALFRLAAPMSILEVPRLIRDYRKRLQHSLVAGMYLLHAATLVYLLLWFLLGPFTPEDAPVEASCLVSVSVLFFALVFGHKCRLIGLVLSAALNLRLWRAVRKRRKHAVGTLVPRVLQNKRSKDGSAEGALDWRHVERDGTTALMQAVLCYQRKRDSPAAPCPAIFRSFHSASIPLDIMSSLLLSQATPDVVDDKGCTAIHHAANAGFSQACELLLKREAVQLYVVNAKGQTPLQVAEAVGHTATMEVLRASLRATQDRAPLVHALLTYAQRRQRDKQQKLHHLLYQEEKAGSHLVHLLSSSTFQPSRQNLASASIVSRAGGERKRDRAGDSGSRLLSGSGRAPVSPSLAAKSVLANLVRHASFEDALEISRRTREGSPSSTVRQSSVKLIDLTRSPVRSSYRRKITSPRTDSGNSQGNTVQLEVRSQEGKRPDSNPRGSSEIQYSAKAVELCHSIRSLLQRNADPNASFADMHPLITAAQLGAEGVPSGLILLMYRADVSVQDKQGSTALLAACWHRQYEFVKALVRVGAPLEARSSEGLTALDVAKQNLLKARDREDFSDAKALVNFLSESAEVPQINKDEVTFVRKLGAGDFGIVYAALYCGVIHAVKVPKHQGDLIEALIREQKKTSNNNNNNNKNKNSSNNNNNNSNNNNNGQSVDLKTGTAQASSTTAAPSRAAEDSDSSGIGSVSDDSDDEQQRPAKSKSKSQKPAPANHLDSSSSRSQQAPPQRKKQGREPSVASTAAETSPKPGSAGTVKQAVSSPSSKLTRVHKSKSPVSRQQSAHHAGSTLPSPPPPPPPAPPPPPHPPLEQSEQLPLPTASSETSGRESEQAQPSHDQASEAAAQAESLRPALVRVDDSSREEAERLAVPPQAIRSRSSPERLAVQPQAIQSRSSPVGPRSRSSPVGPRSRAHSMDKAGRTSRSHSLDLTQSDGTAPSLVKGLDTMGNTADQSAANATLRLPVCTAARRARSHSSNSVGSVESTYQQDLDIGNRSNDDQYFTPSALPWEGENKDAYYAPSAPVSTGSGASGSAASNALKSTAYGLFLHEAVISHKIGAKPHVVQFRGAHLSRDHTMLVYEFFPNNSLEKFLKQAPAQCTTLPRMLTEAATGLWAMHKARIVHRDVAARNFLVDAHGKCAICDFGLSQELPPEQEAGVFPGGPWKWLAPEAMPPDNVFSFKTDVYMFGIFLWEAFARQVPYSGFGHREAAILVKSDQALRPDIDPAWSEGYVSLMQDCWHPSPNCRPSMSQVFDRLKYLEETNAMFTAPSPALQGYSRSPATASKRTLLQRRSSSLSTGAEAAASTANVPTEANSNTSPQRTAAAGLLALAATPKMLGRPVLHVTLEETASSSEDDEPEPSP